MIISYSVFIIGCVVYHGLYLFLGLFLQQGKVIYFEITQFILGILGFFIFLVGIVLTTLLIFNKIKRQIDFKWWNTLLLPLPSMIIFGVVLGKAIYIPSPIGGYYAIISGTIPIFLLVFALGFITIQKT